MFVKVVMLFCLEKFVCVFVYVRAQATALPDHFLAWLQGCGRGGARNGDNKYIYILSARRGCCYNMLLTALFLARTW